MGGSPYLKSPNFMVKEIYSLAGCHLLMSVIGGPAWSDPVCIR
jgi:hypothetical protein